MAFTFFLFPTLKFTPSRRTETAVSKYPGAEGKAQPGGHVGWLCLETAASLALLHAVI